MARLLVMSDADPVEEYRAAVALLAELADEVAAERSQEDVLAAVADLRVAVARVYRGQRSRSESGGGARKRILAHLRKHVGEWVCGDELAAVSGIGEWARRVRELRWEQGYQIEEAAGRYRLLAEDPDLERRDRFSTVTAIRGMDTTVEERVRTLLQSFVGKVVTVDELNRVARGKSGPSVARRIRNRDLLPIETDADAAGMRSGEHRLASARESDLLHPSQRLFSDDLRRQIFSRDRFACRTCRRQRTSEAVEGDVFYLEVRHLDASPDAAAELPADRLTRLSRLVTSCNRCLSL
jgi:biotin operon repressor